MCKVLAWLVCQSRGVIGHSAVQVLEAEELEGLLYAELQRTPKHGAHFCAAVRTILTRETQCVPLPPPHTPAASVVSYRPST